MMENGHKTEMGTTSNYVILNKIKMGHFRNYGFLKGDEAMSWFYKQALTLKDSNMKLLIKGIGPFPFFLHTQLD